MVPVAALPPAVPSTLQVTLEFEVPVTVAVNCCVWLVMTTLATLGETVTVTLGGVVKREDVGAPPPQAVNAARTKRAMEILPR
jgi:hypothetical protein